MVGKIVSHYEILEKLGEGGMGVVYRALDTRLNRPVAIKVLAATATADPARKQRFVQEAKVASSLNHPNIVTIYDIEDVQDATFIVMEYVRGKTIAQLIGRKGLAVRETLDHAVQISSALAAAHGAGIVHRDIKPANIMVTDQGLVKVLDFGLAKLAEPAESGDSGSTATTCGPRTERGTILGTVAYMSPEQAEGKSVDARSDVFSFGAVLYEMVTGRRAFEGATSISTLAAILKEEPKPISVGIEAVPGELERIVTLCLRKEPGRRFQHMADVTVALEHLKEELRSAQFMAGSGSGAIPSPAPSPRRRRLAMAVAGALIFVAAMGALTWWWIHSRKPPEHLTSLRLTWDSGLSSDPVLSPDGKLLAYASDRSGQGNRDVWLQQIADGQAVQLTFDKAEETEPAFSPDGTKIAFGSDRAGGAIYSVPVIGGEARMIAKRGHNPRFSPDGSKIAYWIGSGADVAPSGKVYVVPASGGTPRQLQPDFADARYPIWSPGGNYLLFQGIRNLAASSEEGPDWWVAPVDGGTAIKTGAFDSFRSQGLSVYLGPGDWIDDRVIFSAKLGSSTNLWRARISPKTWEVRAPERVTFGAALEAQPSVAVGGRLVFSSLIGVKNIWCLPIDANQGKLRGEIQRLTQSAAFDTNPSLSADGKRLVFLSSRSGTGNIWTKDLESGKETALGVTSSDRSSPIITPDGSRVAYSALEEQKQAIYVISADGGVAEKVCDDCGSARSWSSDGNKLLYATGQPGRVGLLSLDSKQKTMLLQHPKYSLDQAQFSPEDHWIAFVARLDPDHKRLFIVPFRGAAALAESEWIGVTDGKAMDDKPRWSPAGNFLYFYSQRDGFGCIWKQRLDPVSKRPIGSPSAVYHFDNPRLTLMHTYLHTLDIAVASDKIVLNALECTGSIWMTTLPE